MEKDKMDLKVKFMNSKVLVQLTSITTYWFSDQDIPSTQLLRCGGFWNIVYISGRVPVPPPEQP